jgi:transposase
VLVRTLGRLHLEQIAAYAAKIGELGVTLRAAAAEGETTARLQTMPGIGPVTAMAVECFAPPMTVFRRGRDFAAWLGLVPVQRSSRGKQRLGKTSKMGQRDIRRLLIIGATAVLRAAGRDPARAGAWLARMLVAIALANKMARSIWAMLMRNETYRDPVLAA